MRTYERGFQLLCILEYLTFLADFVKLTLPLLLRHAVQLLTFYTWSFYLSCKIQLDMISVQY